MVLGAFQWGFLATGAYIYYKDEDKEAAGKAIMIGAGFYTL